MNAKKRLRCVRALERLKGQAVYWNDAYTVALEQGNEKSISLTKDKLSKVRFTIERTQARLGASHA